MEQNWNPFLSTFLIFVWMVFSLKKHRILRNLFFDKIFPRIHKNELTYKLCTILEWDKCQQFADFIKFGFFRFSLTQLCKTFVQFFMNKTLESFSEKRTYLTHAYGALEKTLSERIAGLEQKENGNKMNCKSVCRLWKSIFTLHSQLFSSLLSALKTALALKMFYWQFSVASTVSMYTVYSCSL